MGRPILVLGFGPFREISANPAEALAVAVDGGDAGLPVVGRVMTVSYDRCLQETLDQVAAHDPLLVVGVGVAATRSRVCVERLARKVPGVGHPDVDGQRWSLRQDEQGAPEQVTASLDVDAFARAMGAEVSEDAGRYVCNAWLYRVRHSLGDRIPVGFVHLPAAGVDPDRFIAALRSLVASPLLLG